MSHEHLKSKIEIVKDFPKKGVTFYDLTPIFSDALEFADLVVQMQKMIEDKKFEFNKIAAVEARGFIIGSVLALAFEVGFVPIRRCGKLPRVTHKIDHYLEYGRACHEMQQNDIKAGDKILIVDDILATGGTGEAASQLVRSCGAEVAGFAFIARISGLYKGDESLVASLMELP